MVRCWLHFSQWSDWTAGGLSGLIPEGPVLLIEERLRARVASRPALRGRRRRAWHRPGRRILQAARARRSLKVACLTRPRTRPTICGGNGRPNPRTSADRCPGIGPSSEVQATMQKILRVMLALLWTVSTGAVSTGAFAQTSGAEFAQMLDILGKTPKDDALREQIVRAGRALKPAPAIPEEARRELIRGNAAVEEAAGPDDYARAAQHYQGAVDLAPWWGPAYMSLARAQELGQDYQYALEYKEEKADRAKGDYDAKYGWLGGQWTLIRKVYDDKSGITLSQTEPIVARSSIDSSGGILLRAAADTMQHEYGSGADRVLPSRVENSFRVSYDASGQLILETYGERDPSACPVSYGWHQIDFELGSDRRTMTATEEQRYRLPSCEPAQLTTVWVFERVQ